MTEIGGSAGIDVVGRKTWPTARTLAIRESVKKFRLLAALSTAGVLTLSSVSLARGRAAEHVSRAEKTAIKKAEPVSVGHPNEGHLEGGIHLNTSGKDIRVVPAYASGDVRWGHPILIRMIERAARAVAKRYPKSVLMIGDISRKGGGDVLRHQSHESGRDADIGFYALNSKNKQVFSPGFIPFDETLSSPKVQGAKFDLARNWLLIEKLLTDPEAKVSHIFIAAPLRMKLLEYARSKGLSQELINQAALTMMQPTESLAHDDHVHVRISCPVERGNACMEFAKGVFEAKERAAKHNGPRKRGVVGPTPRGNGQRREARVSRPVGSRKGASRGTTGKGPSSRDTRLVTPVSLEAIDDEATADSNEAKSVVDDVGIVKITN